MANKKIECFQFLRGVAIMLVILSHIKATCFISGSLGVAFFMLMSGFFAIYSTEKNKNNFFIKKLIRILPLYYTLTLLTFILAIIKPTWFNYTDPTIENLFKSLMFIPYNVPGIGHRPLLDVGWYLNVEIMFTLIFSLFNKFCHKYRGLYTSVFFIACYILFNLFNFDNFILNVYFENYILYYIFGIMFYYIYIKIHNKNTVIKDNSYIWFIILLIIFGFSNYFKWDFLSMILTLLIFSIIMLFQDIKWNKVLINFGNVSLYIFLLHEFIVKGFSRLIYPLEELNIISITLIIILFIFIFYISIFVQKLINNHLNKKVINYVCNKNLL